MTAAAGMRASDPRAGYRQEVCQFVDDRLSPAQTLAFIHQILGRDMSEVRMFLDRIESFAASLTESERQDPVVHRRPSTSLPTISRRASASSPLPATPTSRRCRARMIKLAHKLGWLSADGERDELMRLAQDLLAGGRIGSADVDLVCSLNRDHALDPELGRIRLSPGAADNAPQAAILACLGSVDGRARVLQALTGANKDEVQIAQVYLQHRPIGDVGELRSVATRIASMADPDAQVRALNTLAGQYVSDRESLDELMRLFPQCQVDERAASDRRHFHSRRL